MNVLIVEDDESKLDSIKSLLSREFPSALIHTAHSVNSAIKALSSDVPDVVVADMSLPTFDIEKKERGGTPRPFGGIEVFEYLDRYSLEVPVVVVTSYAAISDGEQVLDLRGLSSRLKSEFAANFIGTVYFDSTYSTWEKELSLILRPVLES